MLFGSVNTLSLVLSYSCNLRCTYCPVEKDNRSMSWETVQAALKHLLCDDITEIRTAGTDPLSEMDTINRLLANTPESLRFRITTNGLDLNDEIIDLFENDGRVDLVISVDGDENTQRCQRLTASPDSDSFAWFETYGKRLSAMRPQVTVNMVVSPPTVGKLLSSVHFLLSRGFSNLNLLPAYYIRWPKKAIAELNRQFDRLAIYLDGAWRRGIPVYLRNLRTKAAQPLYTDGLVVDTDGQIYSNDIICSRVFIEDRKSFSLGNVHDLDVPFDYETLSKTDWPSEMEKRFGIEAQADSMAVDAELGRLIDRIKPAWKDYLDKRGE